MSVKATVLIPTHTHGPTLRHSVQSALNQTVQSIEVFVVGDGSPDSTQRIVKGFRAKDERVRFFSHPKGPRHGEVYRHEALQQARGKIVCYLADDDLWLPDHIASMLDLLKDANFAHALPLRVTTAGEVQTWPGDLSLQFWRDFILRGKNFIPLSCGAHTRALYNRLPFGWRTTPKGIHTDLYMWQQILNHPECRPVSGSKPTVLHFYSKGRADWSLDKRVEELRLWSRRMKKRRFFETFLIKVLHQLVKDQDLVLAEKDSLRKIAQKATRRLIWRVYNWLLAQPVIGRMLKKRAKARSGR